MFKHYDLWNVLNTKELNFCLRTKNSILKYLLNCDRQFNRGEIIRLPLSEVSNDRKRGIKPQLDKDYCRLESSYKTSYMVVVNPILLFCGSPDQREVAIAQYNEIKPISEFYKTEKARLARK
jgi:hypothetical protein